jgi:hypothetical protein
LASNAVSPNPMNEATQAPKPQAASLQTLTIRDCSFAFRAFFERPRSLESVHLSQMAEAFLDTFREYNVSAADVILEKGDGLFGYSLKAYLFNRLLSINVGAIAVEGTFLRLLAVADRRLAAECIKKLIELFRPVLSQYCSFEAAVHADFNSRTERENFFRDKAQGGLDFGGILAYKKLEDQQVIRIEIDQSYTFENGAFIDFRTMAITLEQLLSSDPIWSRFFKLIEGFYLTLNDV